jgi:hypothetical protein
MLRDPVALANLSAGVQARTTHTPEWQRFTKEVLRAFAAAAKEHDDMRPAIDAIAGGTSSDYAQLISELRGCKSDKERAAVVERFGDEQLQRENADTNPRIVLAAITQATPAQRSKAAPAAPSLLDHLPAETNAQVERLNASTDRIARTARAYMNAELRKIADLPAPERAQRLAQMLRDQQWLPFNAALPPDVTPVRGPIVVQAKQTLPARMHDGAVDSAEVQLVNIRGVTLRVEASTAEPTHPGRQKADVERVLNSLALLSPAQLRLLKVVRVNARPNTNDAVYTARHGGDAYTRGCAAIDGTVDVFPATEVNQRDLDYMLMHEIGHLVSNSAFGANKRTPSWPLWEGAMASDGFRSSQYAAENKGEDFSETFALYSAVKGTPHEAAVRRLMPLRFKLLDLMTTQHGGLPLRVDGFAPIESEPEYRALLLAHHQLGGEGTAAYALLKLRREIGPVADKLVKIEPKERARATVLVCAAFGMDAIPAMEKSTHGAAKLEPLARAMLTTDPALRARVDQRVLSAIVDAGWDLNAREVRAAALKITEMSAEQHAAWKKSFDAAKNDKERMHAIEALVHPKQKG